MDFKDFLMGSQLAVSLITLLAFIYHFGRFTSRVEEGLTSVREDLSEHTTREEKRFEDIRAKFGDLTTAQATQEVRIQTLTAGVGVKR